MSSADGEQCTKVYIATYGAVFCQRCGLSLQYVAQLLESHLFTGDVLYTYVHVCTYEARWLVICILYNLSQSVCLTTLYFFMKAITVKLMLHIIMYVLMF